MRLGIQAAEALHAAHEYGVVHRDIKPSNLLVDADGKLWVTDFGLARCQRDVALTRTGDVVGTIRYMSPEQASGQSVLVDQRTDIYSLGVTLYELLCLRPAFPEQTGVAVLRDLDRHEPVRPRQLQADIPLDLETVVLKAMAKSRDDRYLTAQQFADDLRCVELWPRKAEHLFGVAEEFAQVYERRTSIPATISEDECARLAVDTLQQAVAAGWNVPTDLSRRPHFSTLTKSARFLDWMEKRL